MKKAFISFAVIAVIIVSLFMFTACDNSTVQGQLENIWLSSETFTYDVVDNSGATPVNGTYVVKIVKHANGDIPFGSSTLTNAPAGFSVIGDLTIAGNSVKSGCYYKIVNGTKYMAPYATFRNQTINGETFEMTGTYNGGSLSYSTNKNSTGAVSGSVSAKEPFYDNNEIHQMLRSVSTFSGSFNFNFNVPIVANNEVAVASLNAKVITSENIKTPYTESIAALQENGISCYKLALRRTTEVQGMAQVIYLSTSDVSVSGWKVKHVITKIVEPTKINGVNGNVTYTLRNIEI